MEENPLLLLRLFYIGIR